ncbi:cytochrome c biogenesis CcdA family protein [Actinomycetospora sp.]|uniref:cytochrome c biogenesis CcdA family protein n=1 Tax=Actinomycetospora sp. TaxID=1872135 RepID=UPI002F3EBCBC
MDLTQTVTSGPVLLALVLSLAAGLMSFASPCVVPLVPGYLAYLAGLVGATAPAVTPEEVEARAVERHAGVTATALSTGAAPSTGTTSAAPSAIAAPPRPAARGRWRLAGAAGLFVLGFTVVFVLGLGAIVWAADALIENEALLQRLGGVVTVAMGLVFLGLVPALQRDTRPHWVPRMGLAGAPLLGATFGLGWTPCLGPTLTGVIALASGTGAGAGAWRGGLLVLSYCVGLGVPFVIIALGAGRAVRAQAWLRAHVRGIQIAGGVLLVLVGLALATGLWAEIVTLLREPVAGFSTPL